MSKIGKLSELRKSAAAKAGAKVHPYTLDLGEETVTINPPGARALVMLKRASEDPMEVLELLAGEHAEKILDAIADDGIEVFNALLDDMLKSFGMSNGEESDPTER
ncbi:hypothetical protein HUO13_12070 [Saccharopolyspora erythraea]|uniref:hypothetical protein n=1 Tax=Saccharopolyspora erythraea TaxID=1836 RepID=UPI001BAC8DE3|nr:hypothetical protein [Saccharopolyspora erythraea]QUH01449.1 hypothetical protein HUO13_12070 [Saccharopolyspora erythraea]